MKKLFLSLVVFSVLFNIGCQENMLNDPFEGAQLSELEKTAPQITKGTIRLEGMLVDPTIALTEYHSISGVIGYECHWKSFFNNAYVEPASEVVISLNIKAEITDSNGKNVYLVSGRTKDVLLVNGGSQNTSFKKLFPIQDSKGRMNLVCVFEVSSKGLSLTSQWLETSE